MTDLDDESCAYCHRPGEDAHPLLPVATCANKHRIRAHQDCFQRRHATQAWKKKHIKRSNHDAELCPHATCHAKLQILRIKATHEDPEPLQKSPTSVILSSLVDPCRPCGFLAKSGGPCCQPAIEFGACKRHQRDAKLLREMSAQQQAKEEDDAAAARLKASMEAIEADDAQVFFETKRKATQTDDLRNVEEELRRDLGAVRGELEDARKEVDVARRELEAERAISASLRVELAEATDARAAYDVGMRVGDALEEVVEHSTLRAP